jgi:hypothetical protein
MSASVRYALAFVAGALVGALWGALVGGILLAFMGAFIIACVAMVLVSLTDPRARGILSSTYNMPFSSGSGRRDKRDDQDALAYKLTLFTGVRGR